MGYKLILLSVMVTIFQDFTCFYRLLYVLYAQEEVLVFLFLGTYIEINFHVLGWGS